MRMKSEGLLLYAINERGCWVWRGYKDKDGYGFYCGKRVHRLAYEEKHGPIPEGAAVDHLCKTRACINPDHLQLHSMADAALQGSISVARNLGGNGTLRRFCVNGHEYTTENSGLTVSKGYTMRVCKTCDRERHVNFGRRRTAP